MAKAAEDYPCIERSASIHSSPQWRAGKFRNTLKRHGGPVLEILGQWLRGVRHKRPSEPIPIVERYARDFREPPASGLRITWLGHSTTLIEIDGHRVLLDPVWGARVSPFPGIAGPKRFHPAPLPLAELPDLDAVVISHDHYDHLDRPTIIELAARVPLFVTPLGVGAHLKKWGVPADRIVERDWWDETTVGTLTVTATPARHFSGRSAVLADQDRTLWTGWAIRGPKHSVYYSGDSAMFPGFAEIGERLGPFDAALLETGAYNPLWADVHMGPEQAVHAFRLVRGGLFIPVHWGTFDLSLHSWTEPVQRLLAAAERTGVPVAVPRPGRSVEPASPPPGVRWWPEIPWRRANQAPVVSSGLGASLEARIRAQWEASPAAM